MPRRAVLNLALLLLTAVTLFGRFALYWDPAKPNYEYFPNMAHSPRYDTFSPNPVLPGGETLQPPVPKTIARGYLPLRYSAGKEDAARAGDELTSPFPLADARQIARGQFLFSNFCQHCHGSGGLGDGPVTKRGFPPPPSLLAPHARTIKDGQVFHIVTFGQGNMPAHAAQISPEDRWAVVAYLRSLQAQNPPPPVAAANLAPVPARAGGAQ
jgi:mono/diheme cytochrome c family protein